MKDFDGKLPTVVLANLVGIVLSSSRGFLILKSTGTIVDGVMMPMMNPMKFFNQPLEVPQK